MQHFSFKNGLSLIVHHDANLKNALINVLYRVGSAQESPKNTGIAHFLEHMMFEGSRNFPNFDEQLQSMMAENNAFTGQDYTCYYESFPASALKDVLKIENDRMNNLTLKKAQIDIQTKVIIEEFKETSLNPPLSDVWHHLQKLCFKNSYQWPVIGKNIEHVASINKVSLVSFYKKFYCPKNAILSVVSSYSEFEVAEIVRREFETEFNKDSNLEIANESFNLVKVTGRKQLKRRNIVTSSFYMAFHIGDYATKEYFLSDMVSDLLTNGESSILYKRLVIETKYCTEIQSFTTDNIYCNLLVIEGKLSSDVSFDSVCDEISKIFDKTKAEVLTNIKFETLVNKARTYWSFYHYNSAQLAQNMAIFYQARQVVDLPKFIEDMYRSISKADLKNYLNQLLDIDKASIVEYLPTGKM
jgi:predicted Zn-dependent peptidase